MRLGEHLDATQSVIMGPTTSARAWNSARAIEKARPLTWINASKRPPSQTCSGARKNAIMAGITKAMSDSEIENVAAYYAAATCK
jgi:hypothetical protein